MNVRNHLIEVQCSQRDINDVAHALIHSIIFFRTHGKFNYKHEGSFSIGTLGFERAFCDNIDFNYVRCACLSLVNRINNRIQDFVDNINEYTQTGTLTLEFYTKKPTKWPFNDPKIVWELWNIKIVIAPSPASMATNLNTNYNINTNAERNLSSPTGFINCNNATTTASLDGGINQHHQPYQHSRLTIDTTIKLEDLLSQKLLDIIKLVNDDRCSLPSMPTQPNLDTVFDTSYSELQPYLFNLSYKISETAPESHSMIGGSTTKYSEGGPVTGASAQSSLKRFLLGTLEL